MARSYRGCVGALLLIGAAGPCISTAAAVLMPKAFWPENPPASMNLGNVFFGLGALLTPAAVEYLMRKLSFRPRPGHPGRGLPGACLPGGGDTSGCVSRPVRAGQPGRRAS